MVKRSSEDFSTNAPLRLGYALVCLAIAVAALGGDFHAARWVIAAVFLWAGMTLVGRGRGWRMKRFELAVSAAKAGAGGVLVIALAGAVYFGSLRLDSHGNYPACARSGLLDLITPCKPASRGVWQFPVAVAIAGLGLAGAIGVLKRT